MFLQKIEITVSEPSVQPPSPEEITASPADSVPPLYRCAHLNKNNNNLSRALSFCIAVFAQLGI